MKNFKVTAMIRVQDKDVDYKIIPDSILILGCKLVSFEQLFEIFKQRAVNKQLGFEYVVSLKIVEDNRTKKKEVEAGGTKDEE